MPIIEPKLNQSVRLINAIGEKMVNSNRLSAINLRQDALLEAAMQSTGLEDFGDSYYKEGLSVLLDSAQKDVEFHFLGRTGFQRMVVMHLANRLAMVEELKNNPQSNQSQLKAPFVITGLPRSGTTHLHRMMLTDPKNYCMPIWQMLRIFRHEQPDKRRQIAKRELFLTRFLFPRFDNIHYTRVDSAEECLVIMGLTFFSRAFWNFAPLFLYLEWYIQQDRSQPYKEYADVLRAFQTYIPNKRLTLKSPMHVASIDAILKYIPDAMIIQVHREPAQAFSSLSSLNHFMHSRSVKRFDLQETSEHTLRTWDVEIAKNIAIRKDNPGRVVDVYYEQLRSDPKVVIAEIYDHFGLEITNQHRKNLKSYIREHPQGNHGKHNYNPKDFGLSKKALNERFANYRDFYGIS
jgi:hypothetical protein